MELPLTHYFPIEITAKAEPMVVEFSEGYKQQSSFESLKTTRLNYLLPIADINNLITTLDRAGGVNTFSWLFRDRYAFKQWRVSAFTQTIYDNGRLSELSVNLTEIRVGLPRIVPTDPIPLVIVPDAAPTITRNYLIRSANLGYFPTLDPEPVNPIIDKIQFTSTVDWLVADNIDGLLERARGVYPLLYNGSNYTCKDWKIVYQSESANIEVQLETIVI